MEKLLNHKEGRRSEKIQLFYEFSEIEAKRREQVLEVVASMAASTITNYAGTIANPPLDDPFRPYAWQG